MDIHQMQLKYEPLADRLLMQVRSRRGELFAVWLTRRMAAGLHQPLRSAVTQLGLAQAAPRAIPVPEAREMLEQAVRDRPLPNAEFGRPFDTDGARHPLGPEPLLVGEIDIGAAKGGGLRMSLREPRGRCLDLQLGDDMATALLRLFESALSVADWALTAAATAPPPAAPSGPPS